MTDTTTPPTSTLPNNQLIMATGLGALLGQFLDSLANAHGFAVPPGTFSSLLTGAFYYITGRGRK